MISTMRQLCKSDAITPQNDIRRQNDTLSQEIVYHSCQSDAGLDEVHGVRQFVVGRAPCRLPALQIEGRLAARGSRHAVIKCEDRVGFDVEWTASTRQLEMVTVRFISYSYLCTPRNTHISV